MNLTPIEYFNQELDALPSIHKNSGGGNARNASGLLYENLIKRNRELFNQRPDLYHIANEEILFDLNRMLEHFVEIEEYEKCAKILNTTKEIEKIIKKQV